MLIKSKIITGVSFISLIALATVIYTRLTNPLQAQISLTPKDKKVITLGENVYQDHCATCHGEKLEGQPNWRKRMANGYLPAPPHDEKGHTWHHSDKYLFQITKFGLEKIIDRKYPNNMPIYEGKLSDNEIIAVLSFIKSTWSESIQDHHNQLNRHQN
tara:strand:- start:230 stop:703 length:474 start_codon:yes stop_codon:yes gene_type:complete